MPPDFYASVARLVKARGGRVVLDSSGTALHHALAEGVYLVKPSRRELEHLLGRKATTPAEEEALAREVVDSGRAEIVALTLGADGAVLATRERRLRLASPQGRGSSAVGAGDSFVGAMVWALANGRPVDRGVRLWRCRWCRHGNGSGHRAWAAATDVERLRRRR